jgi:hypothetical protein
MADIDPWTAAPVGRSGSAKKKSLRLAGKHAGSAKVHVLIKLHNWASRAIYVYNLAMPESAGDARMRRIDKPKDDIWDLFSQMGVALPGHPGGVPATKVDFWVDYGREQARLLGLTVEE